MHSTNQTSIQCNHGYGHMMYRVHLMVIDQILLDIDYHSHVCYQHLFVRCTQIDVIHNRNKRLLIAVLRTNR
jgi:hypothetical protein